jgi:hypothetical protein
MVELVGPAATGGTGVRVRTDGAADQELDSRPVRAQRRSKVMAV